MTKKSLVRRGKWIVAFTFLLILALRNGAYGGYVFSSVEIPEPSFDTVATGIGSNGEVVGYYTDARYGNTYGFLIDNDVFTRIEAPGSRNTYVMDIGSTGQLVGFYTDAVYNSTFGFVKTGNQFTKIDAPDSQNTAILGIGANNELAGYFQDASSFFTYGLVLENGTYNKIEGPTSITVVTDVGYDGTIVGYYDTIEGDRAFTLTNGAFETYIPPSSFNARITGIGPDNEVVGYYMHTPASTSTSGFIVEDGSFTTIDYPEGRSTTIMGIGPAGELAGSYEQNIPAEQWISGFVAQPEPVPLPSAVWLLGSGLIGLVGFRRKFRKS